MGKSINENWVKSETLALIKNNAKKEITKKEKYDAEMTKKGYKKIYVNHPTSPRCKIEKWIKNEKQIERNKTN